MRGEDIVAVQRFSIGHRAGMRDGYESRGGDLIKWVPAGWADGRYPYGERAIVIATRLA